jgi:hypothetical protein
MEAADESRRSVFYVAAIFTGILAVSTLFLQESRPSQLLARRVVALRKATGNENFKCHNPDSVPDMRTFFQQSLARPLRLFCGEPIVFMVSVMSAVAFGQIYLLTQAIDIVYFQFGFSNKHASLAFVPIGVGFASGVFMRLYDSRLLRSRQKKGRYLEPEDKIHGFYVGAPCLAIGFWWFAWTIPPALRTYWLPSMFSLVLVGFATNEFDCTLAGYLTDSYTIYAASAFASLAFLRAIISGSLPLIASQMYRTLNANQATSILGIVASIFCISPIILWKYGKALRLESKFARDSAIASARMESMGEKDTNGVGDQMVIESRSPSTSSASIAFSDSKPASTLSF